MVGPSGRKPAVKPEKIEPKILRFQLYDDNNKIKARKDEIWNQISAAFGGLLTPINIYNYVKQNRHNILTNYNKANGIEEEIYDIKQNDEDFEIIVNNNSEDKPLNKKTKTKSGFLVVDINVPPEQWVKIKPVDKQWIDGRIIKRLQEGWTTTFRKLIWSNTKLPCSYSFKGHTINDFLIEAHGSCIECGSKITLKCDTYCQNNESAEFIVETKNTKGILHNKKIRLQKSELQKIGEELLLKTPLQWRLDKAKHEMQQAEQESPDLYKLSQLRRAKRKAIKENVGFATREKLADSLINLKSSIEFKKFIKDIAMDNFHIMYWSPEQIQLHNEILNKLDSAFLLKGTDSSIIQKIQRHKGNSTQVYLTVICTQVYNKIVPVAQLISETHDVALYTYWLQKWVLSGAKVPQCMVTGMDKAFQNAACLAFNSIDFNTYNDICLQYLLGAQVCVNLSTQMRIDVTHLIRAVAKWPCFRDVDWKIKNIFLRCIQFASTIEILEQFEKFFKNVLIISLSKYLDENCLIALSDIDQTIKYFFLDENDVTDEEENVQKGDEKLITKKSNSKLTVEYIEKLTNEILLLTSTPDEACGVNQLNEYYSPDFAKSLSSLCMEFPSWTNVMSPYFDNNNIVITSSICEKYFDLLKLSHNDQRADEFVAQHCKEIDSDVVTAGVLLDNNLELVYT